jgi:hypothetical protein
MCQHVGPVSLPDIANGYFIHPPHTVAANPDPDAVGCPDRIGEPFQDPVAVVVFGSNGGGRQGAADRPGRP